MEVLFSLQDHQDVYLIRGVCTCSDLKTVGKKIYFPEKAMAIKNRFYEGLGNFVVIKISRFRSDHILKSTFLIPFSFGDLPSTHIHIYSPVT